MSGGWFKAGTRSHYALADGERSLCGKYPSSGDLTDDPESRQCSPCVRLQIEADELARAAERKRIADEWAEEEAAQYTYERHTLDGFDQGSDEWLEARRGIVTASIVGKLLTPTRRVASNDTSRSVTIGLAAERITGVVPPSFVTADMMRGIVEEPLARALYAESRGIRVTEVPFQVLECTRSSGTQSLSYTVGYSPDGLVGDDGLIEIKSRNQRVQVQTILDDAVPAENMAQIQCGLWVSGRVWCDYVSYSSGMPLWVKRVTRDEAWIAAIQAAAEQCEVSAAAIEATYRQRVHGLPVAPRTPDYEEITF